MNEPKPLLMLPAPDMTRWVFYKKKPDFGMKAKEYGITTYTLTDIKAPNMRLTIEQIQEIMKGLEDQINDEWKKLFGEDWGNPLF